MRQVTGSLQPILTVKVVKVFISVITDFSFTLSHPGLPQLFQNRTWTMKISSGFVFRNPPVWFQILWHQQSKLKLKSQPRSCQSLVAVHLCICLGSWSLGRS